MEALFSAILVWLNNLRFGVLLKAKSYLRKFLMKYSFVNAIRKPVATIQELFWQQDRDSERNSGVGWCRKLVGLICDEMSIQEDLVSKWEMRKCVKFCKFDLLLTTHSAPNGLYQRQGKCVNSNVWIEYRREEGSNGNPCSSVHFSFLWWFPLSCLLLSNRWSEQSISFFCLFGKLWLHWIPMVLKFTTLTWMEEQTIDHSFINM